jgi:hypothetical protein
MRVRGKVRKKEKRVRWLIVKVVVMMKMVNLK